MDMKTLTIIGAIANLATTAYHVSAMHITAMPRAVPTVSADPWQCVTENLTQYFDVPRPTGTLLTALDSYGGELLKPCVSTATGVDGVYCSVSDASQWCGFTTAAPSAVLSAYSSYGSVAASWWSAKSASATSLATECPVGWASFNLIEEAWLNFTIANAQCFEQARLGGQTTGTGSSRTASTSTTATSVTAATSSVPAPTNGALDRAGGVAMWMLVSTGLVAAVVNSLR